MRKSLMESQRFELRTLRFCDLSFELQGVQEKLCFFLLIHCNPSLAYIAVRDLQSSQRTTSAQSLLMAGNFLYNQY